MKNSKYQYSFKFSFQIRIPRPKNPKFIIIPVRHKLSIYSTIFSKFTSTFFNLAIPKIRFCIIQKIPKFSFIPQTILVPNYYFSSPSSRVQIFPKSLQFEHWLVSKRPNRSEFLVWFARMCRPDSGFVRCEPPVAARTGKTETSTWGGRLHRRFALDRTLARRVRGYLARGAVQLRCSEGKSRSIEKIRDQYGRDSRVGRTPNAVPAQLVRRGYHGGTMIKFTLISAKNNVNHRRYGEITFT